MCQFSHKYVAYTYFSLSIMVDMENGITKNNAFLILIGLTF